MKITETKTTKVYTVELTENEYAALQKLSEVMQGLESDFDIHGEDAWGVMKILVGGYYANLLKYMVTE